MVYFFPMKPCALYVHIPFCASRCSYCDFTTYAGVERLIPRYVRALRTEIELLAGSREEKTALASLYLGGGTPSLLSSRQIKELLDCIRVSFSLQQEAEITLEANPGTVDSKYLGEIRTSGVNRLSLGVQTTHPQQLRLLCRDHSPQDILRAVSSVREAGFDNLSLDLIYGLPEHSLLSWQSTVEQALALEPEHLSLYSLTVEPGTRLSGQIERGVLSAPDADTAAELLQWAAGRLRKAGLRQYELANWALPGNHSRHNLAYWRMAPYLGVGAAAHGYGEGIRTENTADLGEYLRRLEKDSGRERSFPLTPATAAWHRLTRQEEMEEVVIMGLRLTREGVSRGDFQHRFGVELTEVYREPIETLHRAGLLTWAGDRLLLTARGRMLGNRVFVRFLT